MATKRPLSKLAASEALRVAEQTIRALELKADAEYCEDDLKFFLECAWPTLQPGVPFQDNWHIACLCEHLEALSKREIRRLIINLPPRMLKSSLISVAFPAWRWLKAPQEKFLVASYGIKLALRDSRRTRNLIASQWYQARWGSRFALAGDQNEKGRFENDKGGFRIIASVEGGVLGEGGTCLTGDSRIATSSGMQRIDHLVNERAEISVLGSGGWQKITGYSKSAGTPILEFTVGESVLRCTENHPIWIEDYGWMRARDVVRLFYALPSLRMRSLRNSVQEKFNPCREMPKGAFLFEKMLWRSGARGEESCLAGRQEDRYLRELRNFHNGQARIGGEEEVLFDAVPVFASDGSFAVLSIRRSAYFAGRDFKPTSTGRKYCCKRCANSAHQERIRGDANGRFDHGCSTSPYGPGFSETLRQAIKDRDDRKCVICSRTKILHVHHIDASLTNHAPQNLVTLCISCHRTGHTRRGVRKEWMRQYGSLLFAAAGRQITYTTSKLRPDTTTTPREY